MTASGHNLLVSKQGPSKADVSVSISLYNYQDFVLDTLISVYEQDLEEMDLIVVEDQSSDDSAEVCREWLEANQSRFNGVQLIQHARNRGLAAARNTAFSHCQTDYVFVLDADNHLYPRCLSRCLQAIQASGAAFAYPTLEVFGARRGLMGTDYWSVDRLKKGNYIDAMSLVRVAAWKSVGGYSKMKVTGWEDYDFWCKFAEHDFFGIRVPEILARYRVHPNSMLNTTTNIRINEIMMDIQQRHPWLELPIEK